VLVVTGKCWEESNIGEHKNHAGGTIAHDYVVLDILPTTLGDLTAQRINAVCSK
jgi:hypothetical protein